MTTTPNRTRRLRKKLYLDEFAILGFEFSCKIDLSSEADYDQFFEGFADLIDSRDLFVGIDGDDGLFEGFVTAGERYGSASEEDRKAFRVMFIVAGGFVAGLLLLFYIILTDL